MRSVEEVEVTIASRVPRFSNTLTWGVRLLRRAQVNRAVAYGILTYGWRFLVGPVSIVLIGTHFSRELQGYYYTFSSLLALQLFVELGMGTVITQFASHEWSRLGLDEHGRIVGEEAALSRLVSLGRLAFRWYLVAGAIFACGAGIDAIPTIFRKPIVFVNYVPVEYVRSWSPNFITIFKKHWLKAERRFLTFREILESGVGRFLHSEQYVAHGIELIENTPAEITALAIEMDERLKGTWQTTEEDEELQRRFWGLFKPSELNRVFASRIGAEFLRQNRELLD